MKIGPFGSQLRKEEMVEHGLKVYGQENVISDDWTLGERRISLSKFRALSSCELEPGDLVVSMMGTAGKCAVFPGDAERGIMDSHLLRIQPNLALVHRDYFAIALQADNVIGRQVAAMSHGSIMAGLSSKIVKRFKVPLPPVREQPKIVEILRALDTAIHETEAIIAKLKAVKQGLLHDLLTRGIDANGELRPPQAEAPHLYKESPLGWIPKEWDFAPLVSKIDFPEGQVDPRRTPFRDWVLVAPDHVESGTGRFLSAATAAEQQAISGKYVFEAGDVIYSKIRPYLRKAVLVSANGLCSADMYPLRPKAGVNSRYLLAVVLGDQFSRFSESVSMRSGFPKINRSEMAEFSSGWPSSDEQARIAEVLTEADAKQVFAEEEHQKLKLLKSALMDDLLTGRVRVTPLLTEAEREKECA